MFFIDNFERDVRQRLKERGTENKIYIKKRYQYEVFSKHTLSDEEINILFDMKKVIKISRNRAFDERIDAEVSISKNRKIKIIFQFDPIIQGKKHIGKVGIVTAFQI